MSAEGTRWGAAPRGRVGVTGPVAGQTAAQPPSRTAAGAGRGGRGRRGGASADGAAVRCTAQCGTGARRAGGTGGREGVGGARRGGAVGGRGARPVSRGGTEEGH